MSVRPFILSYWHDTTLHIFCHEQTYWSVWMPVRANIGYTVFRMITSTILLFIQTFALTDRKQTTPTTIYSSFSRIYFFTKELSNVLGSSGRLTERYHTIPMTTQCCSSFVLSEIFWIFSVMRRKPCLQFRFL